MTKPVVAFRSFVKAPKKDFIQKNGTALATISRLTTLRIGFLRTWK